MADEGPKLKELLLFVLSLEFMYFIALSQIFLGFRIMDGMIEKDDNVYSFHALHSPLNKPFVCF